MPTDKKIYDVAERVLKVLEESRVELDPETNILSLYDKDGKVIKKWKLVAKKEGEH